MLKNVILDAKIGFDPAENEPPKECCVVALEWTAAGSRVALAAGGAAGCLSGSTGDLSGTYQPDRPRQPAGVGLGRATNFTNVGSQISANFY